MHADTLFCCLFRYKITLNVLPSGLHEATIKASKTTEAKIKYANNYWKFK